MNFMFWKASKPQAVTPAISQFLTSEFGLGPELLATLSMSEKNGKYSNRRVRMVKVFDPRLVSTGEASRLQYDDLKAPGNEKALRFEGRIEMDGGLYMVDRRPKAGSPGADSR